MESNKPIDIYLKNGSVINKYFLHFHWKWNKKKLAYIVSSFLLYMPA